MNAIFFGLNLQKSHFLTFWNDHTVIVQYLWVIPHTTKHFPYLGYVPEQDNWSLPATPEPPPP